MNSVSKPRAPGPRMGPHHKRAIVALVEHGGEVHSLYTGKATVTEVSKIVRESVAKDCRLHTDESMVYRKVGADFASHERVNHGNKERSRRRDDEHD